MSCVRGYSIYFFSSSSDYDNSASELAGIAKKETQSLTQSHMLITALDMLKTGIVPDKLKADGEDMGGYREEEFK